MRNCDIQCRAVAVLLGRHSRGYPFAGINSQLGTLDVLIIENRFGRAVLALTLHEIVSGIIGNIDNFLDEMVRLQITGENVLAAEFFVVVEPIHYRRFRRHIGVAANGAHAFALSNALTNGLGERG